MVVKSAPRYEVGSHSRESLDAEQQTLAKQHTRLRDRGAVRHVVPDDADVGVEHWRT